MLHRRNSDRNMLPDTSPFTRIKWRGKSLPSKPQSHPKESMALELRELVMSGKLVLPRPTLCLD